MTTAAQYGQGELCVVPTHTCFLLIFPRHSPELIVCKANPIAFYQDNEINAFHMSLSLTIGESHF